MIIIRPELTTGIHTLDLGNTLIVFDRASIIDDENTLRLYRCNMIISVTLNLTKMDKAHIKNMCKKHDIKLENE